jgi:hypothetical protein
VGPRAGLGTAVVNSENLINKLIMVTIMNIMQHPDMKKYLTKINVTHVFP